MGNSGNISSPSSVGTIPGVLRRIPAVSLLSLILILVNLLILGLLILG
jgi:hypothetical protein